MAKIDAFEKYAGAYEEWFEANEWAYKSELEAIRRLMPITGKGMEVGIGTGRFAIPLGIRVGVEPSGKMAGIARSKGLEVVDGICENLPFDDETFDRVLLVTTICFVDDPARCVAEVRRVLSPGGCIVIGFIDKNSQLRKLYEAKKDKSKFYGDATFYSVDEILGFLREAGFGAFKTCQTIFRPLPEIDSLEPVEDGHGEGAFVAVMARKPR